MMRTAYISTHLDLGVLHNTLSDDLSDRAVQWQTTDSGQQQSRLCVHQVQKVVKELLCSGQQASQIVVPSLLEDLCQR